MKRRGAVAVVDLGFGDAGKGTVTDYLVERLGATMVIRFNGGAQAGHNVVLADGRHHTFAQFGAGTFVPGVRTHLGPAFVMHPGGLLVEARVLAEKGVPDALARLSVDARVRLISPFQQAAGRLRELARAGDAHGTTGVGVGEAVRDVVEGCDDALVAADLLDRARLARLLHRQQQRKAALLSRYAALGAAAAQEVAVLEDAHLVDRVVEAWGPLGRAITLVSPEASADWIGCHAQIVCEGAQGVLLDERFGFHPHTTWSDCTFAEAHALVADRPVYRLGVTRFVTVRHGPGPMPTEDPHYCSVLSEQHNPEDGWQGRFRVGPLDLVLMRYATDVVGGVDGIAVTWLDRFMDVGAAVCQAYVQGDGFINGPDPVDPDDLASRSAICAQLGAAEAVVCPVPTAEALLAEVTAVARAPVVLRSFGPRRDDKVADETIQAFRP